ncbi:MAG: helix-turn-helix transcriptional regulator [Anaerolineae bacterium]|nr:helix-turn-helix transcriptional regulator [Anaerolineae bacterium]
MNAPYRETSQIFQALAHPVRLQILDLLRRGEICVCHIETALQKRQAYVSQQLMQLREAGIVDCRRDGLQVYYWLKDERVSNMLTLVLGSATSGHEQLATCSCPLCSVVPLAQIS